MSIVEEKLRSLGAIKRYTGYESTVYAIELVIDDELRLHNVTKNIYMEVAEHFGGNWGGVERNIRTVVSRVWKVNRDLLCAMAGYPLVDKPSASEFIEIVASDILRTTLPQP